MNSTCRRPKQIAQINEWNTCKMQTNGAPLTRQHTTEIFKRKTVNLFWIHNIMYLRHNSLCVFCTRMKQMRQFCVWHTFKNGKRFPLSFLFSRSLCAAQKVHFIARWQSFASTRLDSTRLNIKLNGSALAWEYVKLTQERTNKYIWSYV